jgi:hypothetical protein
VDLFENQIKKKLSLGTEQTIVASMNSRLTIKRVYSPLSFRVSSEDHFF